MQIDLDLNRRVTVWRYTVSQSQLVLMSTNDVGEYPTRWYAVLKGVRFISMPTDFVCQRIKSVPLEAETRFEFTSDRGVFHVVAYTLSHAEDDGPYSAPILFSLT